MAGASSVVRSKRRKRFAATCLTCHTVRGDGGSSQAKELTHAGAIVERRSREGQPKKTQAAARVTTDLVRDVDARCRFGLMPSRHPPRLAAAPTCSDEIHNIKQRTVVTNAHPYLDIVQVSLVNHETLKIAYKNDHDFVYITPVRSSRTRARAAAC